MTMNTQNNTTMAELLECETEVWEALVSGDAARDRATLASEFLGVYPSGFATRDDHVGQLMDGPSVSEFVLSDVRTLIL